MVKTRFDLSPVLGKVANSTVNLKLVSVWRFFSSNVDYEYTKQYYGYDFTHFLLFNVSGTYI
jgi:hypothetical protein